MSHRGNISRTKIIETFGERLGIERARGGRGRRLRLSGDTGSPVINFLRILGSQLPGNAYLNALSRSGEEIAQALRRDILLRRLLNRAERALGNHDLPPLTEEERQTIANIGDDAFAGGRQGKSVPQAVSDAFNNQGIPTPLGDHSSDDFDAGRQPLYDASEPGDPEPSAADNLGAVEPGPKRSSRRRSKRKDPFFLPAPADGFRRRPGPDNDGDSRYPAFGRDPGGTFGPPDDGLRGPPSVPEAPKPLPAPPVIDGPPDDGFRDPSPWPREPNTLPAPPPSIQRPPDDGFRDPFGVPSPKKPTPPLVASLPRPRRRPLLDLSSPSVASDGFSNTGFGR